MPLGRIADTTGLNLEAVGVETAKNGKIIAAAEQTSVPHIYACGDVLYGQLELTPVAIQAAKLLVDRLYRGSSVGMDYELVPTTVFTPLEYGAVGLSEEAAIERIGADKVEIFHAFFVPLEWSMTSKSHEKGYIKVRRTGSAWSRTHARTHTHTHTHVHTHHTHTHTYTLIVSRPLIVASSDGVRPFPRQPCVGHALPRPQRR